MKEIIVREYIEINMNDIVKKFESYEYIGEKIDMIINTIKDNIKKIIIDDDKNLHIYLYDGGAYGINYDYKNYPLISFDCEKIMFNYSDTIIQIDDRFTIDLFYIDMNNFVEID